MNMKLSFIATIDNIEQRFKKRHVSGTGNAAVLDEVSEGYFITLGTATFFAGHEPPPFNSGDKIKLTMEKIK